tara:strand:- start:977 stop:1477 length:501 start_codon:yes stop_codon:yes gene_type:complete
MAHSDENKWTQPSNPPPPLFTGKKEKDLVKQVNDELIERVVGQTVAYYPISTKHTNFHSVYGEAINKTFLPPIRVYALVEGPESETTTTRYGADKVSKITVHFHKRRLQEDQDLFVRVGDFVLYGDKMYEIVKTAGSGSKIFGDVETTMEIAATCVQSREGTFDGA